MRELGRRRALDALHPLDLTHALWALSTLRFRPRPQWPAPAPAPAPPQHPHHHQLTTHGEAWEEDEGAVPGQSPPQVLEALLSATAELACPTDQHIATSSGGAQGSFASQRHRPQGGVALPLSRRNASVVLWAAAASAPHWRLPDGWVPRMCSALLPASSSSSAAAAATAAAALTPLAALATASARDDDDGSSAALAFSPQPGPLPAQQAGGQAHGAGSNGRPQPVAAAAGGDAGAQAVTPAWGGAPSSHDASLTLQALAKLRHDPGPQVSKGRWRAFSVREGAAGAAPAV